MKKTNFVFGAQYFRPPFPDRKRWEDDLRAMRDAGLNAVQLWMLWSWCEPNSGQFVFDDYDRLADLAERQGLGVVLSVLPEINPFWVPSEYPEALMVDIEGRHVESCNRWECIAGLVPGACSDHPEIRRRMTDFMTESARHFAPRTNLLAWDVWNENRWRNMATEMVCFCEYSMASLHAFLKEKHGDLDGLSHAWGRKYSSWTHVRPGRPYGYSYPEMHDLTDWFCRRAAEMSEWRVAAVRRGDNRHLVSTHTGEPCIYSGVRLTENLFSRGIDWDVATGDTYGFSTFPKWLTTDTPEEICLRMSSCTTVGGGKPIWLSEVQGGPGANGRNWGPPIPGDEQQSWVWAGISRGAKAAIFWCWRPEIFGIESNALGITSPDGFAEDRLKHIHQTAGVLERKGDVIDRFVPDAAQVAVLFQRRGYFLGWMQQQYHHEKKSDQPENMLAWLKTLERLQVPYAVHDDRHLPQDTAGLRLVVVPDALGLDDAASEWLIRFLEGGGVVLLEGVAGMHGPDTYYRYPNERPFYRTLGITEGICRLVSAPQCVIPSGTLGNDAPISLRMSLLEAGFAPEQEGVVKVAPNDLPILLNRRVGKGRLIAFGSMVGRPTFEAAPAELEALMKAALAQADVHVSVFAKGNGKGFCTASLGRADGRRVLFLLNFAGAQRVSVTLPTADLSAGAHVEEWSGRAFQLKRQRNAVAITMAMSAHDHALLEWKAEPCRKAKERA